MSVGDGYEAANHAYYDVDAPRYDAERFDDASGQSTTRRTRAMVTEALCDSNFSRAIELGPGTGRISAELVGRVEHLVLVDVSRRMLELALSRTTTVKPAATVTALQGSTHAIPCATASADLIVCINVFSHVTGIVGALQEFARVLRPGGQLIFSSTNLYSVYLPAGLLVNARRRAIGRDVPSVWHRRSQHLRDLRRTGFSVNSIAGQYYVPRAARALPLVPQLVSGLDHRAELKDWSRLSGHAPWLLFSCVRNA